MSEQLELNFDDLKNYDPLELIAETGISYRVSEKIEKPVRDVVTMEDFDRIHPRNDLIPGPKPYRTNRTNSLSCGIYLRAA